MCCQRNNLFKLKDCRFRIEKNKESTARVVVFKEFGIVNSFTLECSFFGKECPGDYKLSPEEAGMEAAKQEGKKKSNKKKLVHMSVKEYQSLGESLIYSLNNYLPSE